MSLIHDHGENVPIVTGEDLRPDSESPTPQDYMHTRRTGWDGVQPQIQFGREQDRGTRAGYPSACADPATC